MIYDGVSDDISYFYGPERVKSMLRHLLHVFYTIEQEKTKAGVITHSAGPIGALIIC